MAMQKVKSLNPPSLNPSVMSVLSVPAFADQEQVCIKPIRTANRNALSFYTVERASTESNCKDKC